MAMNAGRGERTTLSEINVTPLVDVMLVLLVIFMVTAPMMQQGIDVNLPRTQARALKAEEDNLVLTITRNQEIFLNRLPVGLRELRPKLQKIYENRPAKEIYLRADRDVPYGFVVRVMAEVRGSGIQRMGMITEPDGQLR